MRFVDGNPWMAAQPIAAAGLLDESDTPATMDEQAFHACYRRTAGPLRAYVVRVMGSVSQADDIVQEAYLRLLRVERPPDDPAAQRALLVRIASNLMVDHWRRTRHERSEAGMAPEAASKGPDLNLRLDMARVFGALRPEQRQLVWLAYIEGASHKEIGAAIGVGERSVRVLLHRAKRKLAGLLGEAGFGGARPSGVEGHGAAEKRDVEITRRR
jgi:RNA polymerase sigma-70 factor (ECF subfamily)